MTNRASLVRHPRKCIECNHIQTVRNKKCNMCGSFARIYVEGRIRNVKRLGDV